MGMNFTEKARTGAAIALPAIGLGLLVIAYFDVLDDDKRRIANVFYQIVAASIGWIYAGLALTLVGGVGQGLRIGARAVNGTGLYVLAVLLPLFPPRPANLPNTRVARIEITQPVPHARVSDREDVCARSTESGPHYIFIQPAQGAAQRQDGVLRPGDSGEFCGKAAFGTALAGEGEEYTIQIAASKSALKAGELLPKNLVWSRPVMVRRADPVE
jgi:hypothetical protein